MKQLVRVWACLVLLGTGMAVQARTVHLYYTDPQGTVLAKTDAQGNVIERYDYRPYGGVVSGTGPNGPGYTGHVQDPETGLVYMQQRYYDPMGRFPSPDPVGPSPGNLFSFNRYDYANNNPTINVDPDGRCPVCAVAAVAGAMAVGAGIGAGIDWMVQKAFNPHKPVDLNEVKVAAALGAVSGGTDAIAMSLVRSGTVSVGRAVAANVAVNSVAGGVGRVVQGKMDGVPATNEQIASAVAGNAVGTLAANGIGYIAGDFSKAASNGAAANMSKAAVNSPAGIGGTIANTTAGVGIGAKQSAAAAALSQAGQAAAQGMTAAGQTTVDKHFETIEQ